jgi:hypothetical protein
MRRTGSCQDGTSCSAFGMPFLARVLMHSSQYRVAVQSIISTGLTTIKCFP